VVVVTAYRVTYERDADEYWVADAPELVGAHTQGRTIPTARARIREVIALIEELDDEDAFDLEEEFVLPDSTARAIASALEKRHTAELARMDAMAQMETGAKLLIEGRVSMRDAADILGISSGRVQQLVTGDSSRGASIAHTASTRTITITGMKKGKTKTVTVPIGSTKDIASAAPGKSRTTTRSKVTKKAAFTRRATKKGS
jgi:predicted RNase H-like HicB family nuclease